VNTPRDEGVIKFKFTLKRAPAPEMNQVIALEKWRALFYRLGLIGEYPIEKVGYGNLSSRLSRKIFIITGTQTGHLPHLQAHHYTKVIDCDLKRGQVSAEGLIPPSSESLTHFGIYEANEDVQFVFHVHHGDLWRFLMTDPEADSIPEDVPYGTTEMAEAASHILRNKSTGLIVMKGHEDGIIAYGNSAEDTGKMILDAYRKLGTKQ
jgi:ribulose-5-phosphate 4-epimerase/fuculose-1-phosphate aldolase